MLRSGLPLARILKASVCILFCCCSLRAVAGPRSEPTDTGVGAKYENTRMMLRNFYCGHELRFDATGNLVSGGKPGPWTVCRDIQIEKLQVSSGKLKITGHRVYLFYDPGIKLFKDILEIESREFKKTKSYQEMMDGQRVSIEIKPVQQTDDAGIAALMSAVFYTSTEEFLQGVPEFWKSVVDPRPGVRPASPSPANGVFHPGNGVSAPVAMYSPDPDYAEEARLARFKGVVVLTATLGPDGLVHRVKITRPLGMGLDEKAVAKVLNWKFRPATKDGQPVAVDVRVEVAFNLY